MTFTVREYDKVDAQGEPIEPCTKRTPAIASAAGVKTQSDTVCAVVVATVDTHIRISTASEAATADDMVAEAYKNYRLPIEGGAYINGLTKS